VLSKTPQSIALQALIFTKSLKQRCYYDKFLMFASFCMRIAKPSLPITQFVRLFFFCSKFRACVNVKIYFGKDFAVNLELNLALRF